MGKGANKEIGMQMLPHITPPITLEKELIEERDLLFSILSSMGEGLFVVDREGKIVLLNTIAQKMLQIGEDATGKNLADVLSCLKSEEVVPVYDYFLNRVLKQGQVVIIELSDNFFFKSNSGNPIPVVVTASPLKGEDLSGAVIVFHDVTKEKNVDKVKSEFLSVAAHQLRTPLGVMRWNLELMLNSDQKVMNAEKTKEILLQIYKSNQRMIKLVNDLLSVSRIDQEKVMDRPSLTDIAQVIKDVISELTIDAQKKGISLLLEENPVGQIPKMLIDSGRFRDIMVNLIANGIKYNIKDGKVTIRLSTDGTLMTIIVTDTGIGIPDKDRPRIFQKFFRAENAILNATEGSGLGLYLVKSYVEGWGGQIGFESEMGKGATFTIKLPIQVTNNK